MSGVCWAGSTRYSRPLSESVRKKFQGLRTLGPLYVIGFSPSPRFETFKQEARFLLLPNVSWPALRYLLFFLCAPVICFWLLASRRARVIIAQGPYEALAGALAKLALALLGRSAALVVESHGDFETGFFAYRGASAAGMLSRLMRLAARFSLSRVDVLRCISRATQAQLRKYRPDVPIVVCPAWTDLTLFQRAGQVQGPPAGQRIVYAGVVSPIKGLHHLLAAFARLAKECPQAHLCIIGSEPDPAYAGRLRKQARTLQVEAQVEFTGHLPQEQLAEAMATARLLVLPSLSEGLGRVLLEAMAAGRPVVASRVGGVPDVVHHQVNGLLVAPGDEEGLALAMKQLLHDDLLCRRLGQGGQRLVEAFFTPRHFVESHCRVVAAALGHGRGEDEHCGS